MDFLELASRRQSTRKYDTTRLVEAEKIERIIEAARLAPSACNAQPWHFVVVNDAELMDKTLDAIEHPTEDETQPVHLVIVDELELKNKVADAASARLLGMNHFTKQAPIHILLVEEKVNLSSGIGGVIKDKHFAYVDIGIAASHICLAAEDEGLGSCILGWFNESKIKKLLNIPDSKRVILDILIGYPAQELRSKKRKSTNEIVSYNTYKK
ncbi:nitroreductase family protein [Dysgonomonas sp. HGC4]|uniref:nitroreductase family protein n=1 Tax=Dysgonomonas sp. HGC4 TaxID=1658009 RepID=UPI0006812EC0|nr:nitroreductase family protein [Dysgonomonas sp. HGC4]MBD8349731.1 nitroreductase family protein [Dysgonomonas sp. HGC4]